MVFRRKLTRGKLLDFFASQPQCTMALGLWRRSSLGARVAGDGHQVRLIPPAYVKSFVKRKRNKNDAIDGEAICEAAQRPGMRFVAVKSEEQQAAGLVFRTRDLWCDSAPSSPTRSVATWRSMVGSRRAGGRT